VDLYTRHTTPKGIKPGDEAKFLGYLVSFVVIDINIFSVNNLGALFSFLVKPCKI
jgi:hypothetical protein